MQKLDILVIAVHPDDAELGCSGTLLKHVALGHKVGMVDLTQGELGSRGSAEIRLQEATQAAEILGLSARENLQLADGFFKNDKEHQLKVIAAIRKYQPDIVITNAYYDRHPDHGRACELVTDSVFLSGLRKIETYEDGQLQKEWRPNLLLHFIQDQYIKPDFIVDITAHWDKKIECIRAYGSQFYNPEWKEEHQTYISGQDFYPIVEGRAREFGKVIGARFGEGFLSKRILGVDNLMNLR
ncbi:bacillithiol biosynthesis deacetylase BshB1 [Mucilaginibacter gracilis]|uniref:Bacillithiol biosynthesis deacetylase BshB1 n=1 Tax=Mucilaginibacter gracilis TaxID=423350 RepID=A0A495J0X6_9SPHI|nr:bacillithiol biosynthesis deacetylase BshB1 [Mucilaginibacter gracilis]RKR82597.1 bacillithiol biosynthesis deacetylase BshB1 [Mucilaginibacter gracilis]